MAGWGLTDDNNPESFSNELLAVKLHYVNRSKCHSLADDNYATFLTEDKICVFYNKGKAGIFFLILIRETTVFPQINLL